MSDTKPWFAKRRFGYGAGLPLAWQGWALLAGFLAVVAAIMRFVDDEALRLALISCAVLLLSLIAAPRTEGGWRWRWGRDR